MQYVKLEVFRYSIMLFLLQKKDSMPEKNDRIKGFNHA